MANKVEKEKPRKNVQKLASLAFGHFFKVFPFVIPFLHYTIKYIAPLIILLILVENLV